MKRETAYRLLGETPAAVARALGMSTQAVRSWPEDLSRAISDRVIGARVRIEHEQDRREGRRSAYPELVAEVLALPPGE